MADLEAVISESVDDAIGLEETPEPIEAQSEPAEVAEPTQTPDPTPEAPAQPEVKEEVKETKAPEADDFDKKYGLQAQNAFGRENRIPYSRVKKITDNAVKDAKAQWEKEFQPKLSEYETKLKTYEEKIGQMDRFEQVLTNEPQKFMEFLSTIPAYQPFFRAVEDAFAKLQGGQTEQPQAQASQEETDPMPQPDQPMPDGSAVYSLEGLKKLLDWQARQVEAKVTKQVSERYKPIETEWQAQQKLQAVIPQVRAQIEEARTWSKFTENEEEIVKALQANKSLSLEGAYRQVVFPKLESERQAEREKLIADRNKIREEVLAELKKAPTASSAPAAPSRSSAAPTPTGPREIEDIIAEQIKSIKR